MNNKRNIILIVVIVFLAFFAVRRSFLFHPFGRHHFIGTYNSVYQEDKIDHEDDGLSRVDIAISHMEDGLKEVDKAMARIDEELKDTNFSKSDFDRSDSIFYGGYLKKEFPYPIIFHFEKPIVTGGKIVANEVFYPKSLMGKSDIKNLDSTNSVNVYIKTSMIQTTEIIFITKKTLKYSQNVNYHFSYPLIKKNHDLTVAKDTGTFVATGKMFFGFLLANVSNPKVDKHKRLNIENRMVTRIRSILNKDTVI